MENNIYEHRKEWCKHFGFPYKIVGNKFYYKTAIQTLCEDMITKEFKCFSLELFDELKEVKNE